MGGLVLALLLVSTPYNSVARDMPPSDSGSMQVVADLPFSPGRGVQCADADHDGRVEFYCLAETSGHHLCAIEHVGNFVFQLIQVSQAPLVPGCLGDVDRDGLLDLIVHNQWNTGLYVYESPDSFSLPTDSIWRVPGSSVAAYNVCISDIDTDSARELVVVADQSALLRLYECSGDNSYEPMTAVMMPGEGAHFPAQMTDLNRNGRPELAIGCGRGTLALFEAVEDDSVVMLDTVSLAEYSVNTNVWTPVWMPDLDRDGKPELAVQCSDANLEVQILDVLEAISEDSFAIVWADTTPESGYLDWQIAVGNVEGDSSFEFAAINAWCVRLFRCIGNDRYECFWRSDSGGCVVALYDIDFDGKDELIQDNYAHTHTIIRKWLPAGIEEQTAQALLRVEAQPSVVRSNGVVRLAGIPQAAEVEVLDASGRVVSTLVTGNWSTGYTPPGAYFIRIRTGNQAAVWKLLVVE